MVTTLTRHTGGIITSYANIRWHWQGRPVHLVDGATVTLGMEHLRCKTPEMAIKELWVYLLAYNLIRMMLAASNPPATEFQIHNANLDCLAAARRWNA
jgi:hypothetical protein